MRKILLIVIVVLSVVSLKIVTLHAEEYNMLKKLYIVLGSTDTLTYPGYELVETNVNYYIEGIYTAKYKEDITDRIFIFCGIYTFNVVIYICFY